MIYREVAPPEWLADDVACFWSLRVDDAHGAAEVQRILPDGRAELIFNLAAPNRQFDPSGNTTVQPRALLIGQITTAAVIAPTGAVDLVGVRFRTAGQSSRTGVPAHELTDRYLDASLVSPRFALALEQIANTTEEPQRFAAIAEALALRAPRFTDPRVRGAVRLIREQPTHRVRSVAQAVGVSERQLERAFEAAVGVRPKLLARIERLQRVVKEGASLGWAAAAVAHGFADQAHFNRDFRAFAGISPGRFFGASSSFSDQFGGVSESSKHVEPASS